jgi:phosphohistidine swiveling domain-containing protein
MKKANKPLVWDTFSITNKNSNKFFEIPFVLTHSKLVGTDIYFGEDAVNKIKNAIREKIDGDIEYPAKIAEKFYRLRDEALKITHSVDNLDLKSLSNEELIRWFDRCFEQIGLIECFMSYRGNVELSDILTEKIKEILSSKLNKKNQSELLEDHFLLLSMPKKESYMVKMQNDALKIGALIQNNKDAEKEIMEFHKNHSWVGCAMFDGEHISIEKFREDINSKLSLDCKNELEKQDIEKKDREEKIRKLADELNLDDSEMIHLENLREWFFLRTYAKDCVNMAIADTMKIMYEITERTGISKDDLGYLRRKEIEEIFTIHKEDLLENIAKRKERVGVEIINDETTFYYGDDVAKIEEKSEESLEVNEVKGTIASKGKIKGKVRYLKDASELSKIEQRDILVTPMTTTDFTPILDKISGIVTDEGGLTCHAAIVSRELNIPCIIGTKIATRVFKDNDIVELDAENGIIRKIK